MYHTAYHFFTLNSYGVLYFGSKLRRIDIIISSGVIINTLLQLKKKVMISDVNKT